MVPIDNVTARYHIEGMSDPTTNPAAAYTSLASALRGLAAAKAAYCAAYVSSASLPSWETMRPLFERLSAALQTARYATGSTLRYLPARALDERGALSRLAEDVEALNPTALEILADRFAALATPRAA